MHNYISRLDTVGGSYHVYHLNTIIFSNCELPKLVVPGLLHELKVRSHCSEMFKNIVTVPSLYELPSYIIADKLIEEIRSIVARCLLFVHTWVNEHPELNNAMLDSEYETYGDFFFETLEFIINNERNSQIRNIAVDLKQCVIKISPYLGLYDGNLGHLVHRTQDILSTAAIMTGLYCVFGS